MMMMLSAMTSFLFAEATTPRRLLSGVHQSLFFASKARLKDIIPSCLPFSGAFFIWRAVDAGAITLKAMKNGRKRE